MSMRDLKDFLNRDVTDVFGRKGDAAPDSAACQDAQLEVRTVDDRLELHCTSPRMRFFSLQAKLAGVLSITRAVSADRVPTIRITIPVRHGTRPFSLDVIYYGEVPSPGHPLKKAALVPSSHGRQLEFVLGDVKDSTLYRFNIPDVVELSDFQPYERQEAPVTAGPPSVAQLGALLRATLRQRRDAISIMEDLSAPLSTSTIAMVADLRDRVPARHSFTSLPVQWLQEHLAAAHVKAPNPFRLAALALLLDMEAGKITGRDIDALADGRAAIVPSWEAVKEVARFEGHALDMRTWKDRYEAAGLEFPARADSAVFEKMTLALALIEDRMHQRDTRAVLANLVRESPSPRVAAISERWDAEAKRGASSSPTASSFQGFEDFYRFLVACGVRMDPNTLKAFCLYAEVEAGRLAEERFVQWLQGFVTINLSPYAMQAVAAALDVELLALDLSATQPVEPLLQLAPAGVLQGLETDTTCEATFRYLEAPDAPMDRGWRPSGGFLLRVPVLDQLSASDLALFRSQSHAFYGCFQSDLDRRRLWKRVNAGDANGTFLEGFRVYHFQGRILAELRAGESRGLEIYKDNRGSLHYFIPESSARQLPRGSDPAPSPGSGMERQPLHLGFAPIEGLPELLPEMTVERLLGRVEQVTGDLNRLERVGEAVRMVLAAGDESGPALASRGMRGIAQNVEAPRLMQILRPVVDGRTLDHIRQNFLDPDKSPVESHIYEPVLQGLKHLEILDFACLALVYELCASDVTSNAGFHKSYNRQWFRAALRNQLLSVLESENPQVRRLGCRLLSTSSCVGDASERPVVEYELQKQLDSADPEVAQEAAASLARLALEDRIPLPPLWCFRKPETASATTHDRAAPVVEVMQEIRDWQASLQAMLGTPPAKAQTGAGSSPALLEMARLIAGARVVFQDEGPSANAWTVAVADERALKALMERFVQAWHDYGDETHQAPRDVIASITAGDGLDAFLAYARANPAQASLWWPTYEAGVDAPMWPLPSLAEGGVPLWVSRPQGQRTAVSPLFLAVLSRVMEDGEDAARLLRFKPSASTEGAPAALALELFNPRGGNFEPFLLQMRIPSQFFLSVPDQELVSALVGHLAPAPALQPTPQLKKAAPATVSAEQAPREARLIAVRILEVFQLPTTLLPQVMYVLQEACANTGRKLW